MSLYAANTPLALDMSTLLVVATCVTALLGVFLLFAWLQDRVRALAWWGTAYLTGGFSVVIWSIEGRISPPLPPGIADALVFVACGMIWNAARLFHGRHVLWGAMVTGATLWVTACHLPEFAQSTAARVTLSSLIVSGYTFLTAAELWRERRRHLLRRWPAIFVPVLHGAVFLFPIPLASIVPHHNSLATLASGWIAIFALEVILYIVGSAFIVLVLSKERSVRIHKDAASTDELTGLLNRRGFQAAARQLRARLAPKHEPISVLAFDLDHFKKINDRFGHAVGDEVLSLFAATMAGRMRESDIVARFGGEEFVAMLPGSLEDAKSAASRVRAAFETAAVIVAGQPIGATVSVGVASGAAEVPFTAMLAAADAALYRAKEAGRNRVEVTEKPVVPTQPTTGESHIPAHKAPTASAPEPVLVP